MRKKQAQRITVRSVLALAGVLVLASSLFAANRCKCYQKGRADYLHLKKITQNHVPHYCAKQPTSGGPVVQYPYLAGMYDASRNSDTYLKQGKFCPR